MSTRNEWREAALQARSDLREIEDSFARGEPCILAGHRFAAWSKPANTMRWIDRLETQGPPVREIRPGDSVRIQDERCFVVRDGDTREELIGWGMKPEAADEILAFREYLKNRKRGEP